MVDAVDLASDGDFRRRLLELLGIEDFVGVRGGGEAGDLGGGDVLVKGVSLVT